MSDRALVIIKPDGMSRGLVGNVIDKFSAENIEIVGIKSITASEELAREHYAQLADKDFFEDLIKYLTGQLHPVKSLIALIYDGDDAIKKCRTIAGATHPEEADPTTIRGAYGRVRTDGLFENVVHVSSDPEEAEREIKLWFSPSEVNKEIYSTKTETGCERVVWT